MPPIEEISTIPETPGRNNSRTPAIEGAPTTEDIRQKQYRNTRSRKSLNDNRTTITTESQKQHEC
jgi:hypothetical protein